MEDVNKLNSKVNVLLFLVIVSVVLNIIILGGGKDTSSTSDLSNSNSQLNNESSSYDVSSFKEIKATDIANFDKKDVYVVYIGRPGCSWCEKMLPVLKQAQSEYKYTTQYIDISKIIDFTSGNYEIIDETSNKILTEFPTVEAEKDVMQEFGATPMILFIKNNKIIASQIGYNEYENFVKVVEKAGLKK